MEQLSLFGEPVDLDLINGYSQEEIDRCIRRGGGYYNGAKRIYGQFLKGQTREENIKFLKSEYGIGGCFPAYCCEDRDKEIGMDWDTKGILLRRVTDFNKKLLLTWPKVAQRIGELIAAGEYLNEEDNV